MAVIVDFDSKVKKNSERNGAENVKWKLE